MKQQWRGSLVSAVLGLLLLHANIGADEKKAKEPEKKPAEPAKPIVINDELINADLKDKVLTGSACKTYTLKMQKDKTYHIELASPGFPAHVRLENPAGSQIDAGTSQFGAACISHRPAKTEDHTIIATTQNAGAVGKFTLTVTEIPEYDGKPIELKNENGQGTHTGPLLKTDPVRNGKRHRVFVFNMEKGQTYQIDMTSKAFDSYLFLESPDGKTVLTQDDDGGAIPAPESLTRPLRPASTGSSPRTSATAPAPSI